MLSQLIYVSKRTKDCYERDIEQILERSVANNQKLGVTGVLLYSQSRFLQYIEGDFRTIMTLYEKIKKDERHYDATMIALMPISKRVFPNWQMAGKSLNLDEVNFKKRMSLAEQNEFEELLSGQRTDGARVTKLIANFFY